MKKIILSIAILSLLYACYKVPFTGRSRLNLVNDLQLQQEAEIGYKQLLSDPKIKVAPNNSVETQRVKRVGQNIANAVTHYMNQNGFENEIANYKWEFNLIESKEINAWCMPGGKVVVYTGILPVTKDDAGLATVLGHEIAHAIAQHSAERASQILLAQVGNNVLEVATNNSKYAQYINQAYGIGGQLVILKYGRNQESEADKMGLSFMAMAGYNPNAAVNFWERMAQASSNQAKPPVFLSTHPADETRIAQIKKDIPEAMKYYTGK